VKLAWLTPNLHPSGGPRMAMELGAEMAARGHDFSIYIPSGRCRMPVKPGVRVVECGWAVKNPLTAIAAALASMPKLIDRPEIILASMPPYALLAEKINPGIRFKSDCLPGRLDKLPVYLGQRIADSVPNRRKQILFEKNQLLV